MCPGRKVQVLPLRWERTLGLAALETVLSSSSPPPTAIPSLAFAQKPPRSYSGDAALIGETRCCSTIHHYLVTEYKQHRYTDNTIIFNLLSTGFSLLQGVLAPSTCPWLVLQTCGVSPLFPPAIPFFPTNLSETVNMCLSDPVSSPNFLCLSPSAFPPFPWLCGIYDLSLCSALGKSQCRRLSWPGSPCRSHRVVPRSAPMNRGEAMEAALPVRDGFPIP